MDDHDKLALKVAKLNHYDHLKWNSANGTMK